VNKTFLNGADCYCSILIWWLDAGELDQLLVAAKDSKRSVKDFLNSVPPVTTPHEVVTGGRNSPITGKPMNQDRVLDVAIDRCPDSGGIWLDGSELAKLLKSSHQTLASGVKDFFSQVLGLR
jgi:Zn-finger nucleic acid-binding protein